MKEQKNAEVQEAYAAIGRCAVTFSKLEYHLQGLHSHLAHGSVMAVETFAPHARKSFGETTRAISKLASEKKASCPQESRKLLNLCRSLESIRLTRNLFVHGFWLINEFLLADGIVRCCDTFGKEDPSDGTWSRMHSRTFTLPEIDAIQADAAQQIDEVQRFISIKFDSRE